MDWTEQIDAYCERLGPGYWAEPVNALTNLAFVLAGLWMWRRTARPAREGRGGGRLLSALLMVIGLGSWLFHTHATAWAAAADSLPILAFSLVYIHLANRDFWGWRPVPAALGAAAFLPYSAALSPVFSALPFLSISAAYWPLPLLIAVYAVLLRRRHPPTARGLALGAALLSLSLTFRSLDMPLCAALPLGTHFLWHLLNAVMLGWMIEVWRRHVVAGRPRER